MLIIFIYLYNDYEEENYYLVKRIYECGVTHFFKIMFQKEANLFALCYLTSEFLTIMPNDLPVNNMPRIYVCC